MTAQHIDLGWAPVLALRATYAGELGWELHVPAEYLRDLYDKIVAAGEDLGLRDVGYRAIESLRLEKQYLAWAGDIRSDNNPYEAGLGFAVKPDKPALLAGPALRADQGGRPGAAALLVLHRVLHGATSPCTAASCSPIRARASRRPCAAPGSASPSGAPSSPPTCPAAIARRT